MTQRRLVKLVRDRVADLLPHVQVSYEPIDNSVLALNELRKKLAEETAEYLIDPCISELADVYEAVRALAEVDLGVSVDSIITEARRKRQERGGFTAGVGMYAYSEHLDGDR